MSAKGPRQEDKMNLNKKLINCYNGGVLFTSRVLLKSIVQSRRDAIRRLRFHQILVHSVCNAGDGRRSIITAKQRSRIGENVGRATAVRTLQCEVIIRLDQPRIFYGPAIKYFKVTRIADGVH